MEKSYKKIGYNLFYIYWLNNRDIYFEVDGVKVVPTSYNSLRRNYFKTLDDNCVLKKDSESFSDYADSYFKTLISVNKLRYNSDISFYSSY